MVASQRFPTYFDGIVAGNPGFDLPQAAVAEAWNDQALAPLATRTDTSGSPYIPDTFPPGDLQLGRLEINVEIPHHQFPTSTTATWGLATTGPVLLGGVPQSVKMFAHWALSRRSHVGVLRAEAIVIAAVSEAV